MERQCQANKTHLKPYKEAQLLGYGGHIGTRRKVGGSGRGCALRTLCVTAGLGGGSYGLFRPGISKLWCVINHPGIFQMQDVIQWAWGGTRKSTGFIRSQVLGPCPSAPETASITGHWLRCRCTGSTPDLLNQSLHFHKIPDHSHHIIFERCWSGV